MCDTVIETARLYLRHFRKGDEYDLFEYLSEPEVNCFRQMKTDDLAQAQKADVIAYALKKCEIKDKKRAVMVGDREHDIIGAKTNGLSSIGVLYGYGSKEELLEAGANYIANSPADILHYI